MPSDTVLPVTGYQAGCTDSLGPQRLQWTDTGGRSGQRLSVAPVTPHCTLCVLPPFHIKFSSLPLM
jgi:hypothetical protein